MKRFGQSAMEWLMTHMWAVIVVLVVGVALAYMGAFEASARPRFEGLAALGLRPFADQVQLYPSGFLVLTIGNSRPYNHRFEWVEIAPISDREDVVQTLVNMVFEQGDVELVVVNASNLLNQVVETSVLMVDEGAAKEKYVDFHICINESYKVGGRSESHVVCGKGFRIPYTPSSGGSGLPQGCECLVDTDCELSCEVCYYGGGPEEVCGICDGVYGCDLKSGEVGELLSCEVTAEHPEGECCTDPAGETCYDDLI